MTYPYSADSDLFANTPSAVRYTAIKAEGISGQNLRRARRLAKKYKLNICDDYDAVLQLRRMGINPFGLEIAKRFRPRMAKLITQRLPDPLHLRGKGGDDWQQKLHAILAPQQYLREKWLRRVGQFLIFIALPTLLIGVYFLISSIEFYLMQGRFAPQTPPARIQLHEKAKPTDALKIR